MTTQDKIKFDKEALRQRYRVRDTDHDNVPDVFDCKPYDQTQDGLFGDVFSAARRVWSRAPVHFSASRAASRRAAVRRTVAPSVRRVTRRVTRATREVVRRAPIHVSHARAVRRRASIRRDITRTARPITTAMHGMIARTGVDYERAKQRRGAIATAGWRAPTRALTEIATMGAPFRKKMEQRIEATTARQQAKFPKGTLSALTTGIAERTARVARVARGFEKPVEQRMQAAETTLGLHSKRIPAPLRWAGGQAKQFGYGVAFGAPAAMVEQAGMVPAAVETMARRPEIIPAAVGVGLYTMGKGMFHGATTHPSRMAGEFVGMGAIARGAPEIIGKTSEAIRFRGKELVPAKTIVEERLLTGAGEFPTVSPRVPLAARPAAELKMFRESPYKLPHEKPGEAAWHATTAKFSERAEAAVGIRPETAPGLHLSHAVSTHFLRLQKARSQITFFGVPSIARAHPGLLRVGVEAFERIPEHIREAGAAERVKFIYEQKGVPKAYITPAVEAFKKTEVESVIAPGTPLIRTHFRYYTTLEGKKVPIYEYKAIEGERMPKGGLTETELARKRMPKGGSTAAELARTQEKELERYYSGEKQSIVTPASYVMPYHKSDYAPPPTRGYYRPPPTERYGPPPTRGYYRPPPTERYGLPPTRGYYRPPPTERYVPPPLPPVKYPPPPPPTYKVPPPLPPVKYPPPPPPTYKVPPPLPPVKYPPPPPPTHKVPLPPLPPPTPTIRIPKTKGKKKLMHKRRKHKPEYWQIENPIANIREMMFGRLEDRRLSK